MMNVVWMAGREGRYQYQGQESPPAWTQVAYRPPCSEYSFCCPTWVPPPGGYPDPPGGYPVRYLLGGYPVRYPRGVRVPPQGGTQTGTPLGGVPGQVPPRGLPRPPGGTQSGTPRGVPGTPRGVPDQIPPRGVPDRVPPRGVRVPPLGVPRPPRGYPVRYPPGGYPDPPHCLMAFWEMLQSIMGYGYPPPPVDRQIDGWTDAVMQSISKELETNDNEYNLWIPPAYVKKVTVPEEVFPDHALARVPDSCQGVIQASHWSIMFLLSLPVTR